MKNGNAVDDKILKIVKNINPETVDQLIQYLEQELNIPQKKALEHVIRLNNAGKINLSSPSVGQVTDLNGYLRSSQALWFWCVMTLALSTLISVFFPNSPYLRCSSKILRRKSNHTRLLKESSVLSGGKKQWRISTEKAED